MVTERVSQSDYEIMRAWYKLPAKQCTGPRLVADLFGNGCQIEHFNVACFAVAGIEEDIIVFHDSPTEFRAFDFRAEREITDAETRERISRVLTSIWLEKERTGVL